MQNNKFINYQKFLAKELGTSIFNIDDNFESKKIINLFKINKKKYNQYKKKYLTSLNILKPNFKIIGENFL